MYENIRLKLNEMLKETSELKDVVDEIDDENDLASIGINSIGFVKLIVKIEGEFGFQFDDEYLDYTKFKTVNDLVLYVLEKNNVSNS